MHIYLSYIGLWVYIVLIYRDLKVMQVQVMQVLAFQVLLVL